MSKADILEELRRMPEAERNELVEIIGIEFGTFDDELTPEQVAELERRAAEARAHPERCRPLEDVLADMQQRFRERR